ncbi:polyprenyl synthetase family protein [Blastococcus sp. MG754426]|uniref:polyprenyl synthetase family protein n=1 Tax=unclassified Blastococcus TaxID=2619396 RepID=UPI001EEFE8B2|nr:MULTISPECIES: polyprenyl synthetase family protein [unclassified Blastococcus]MCF6508007.1 polyprenyl synthetase family protein [Blastococcus sp. MG754426]MCF6512623.1 polyprenyl synthetase family protein [Blastococcus sp. MG754427]MCF6734017.1 polyprenyl synthetase family protein [Blastococcus sp. KM273129]
MTAGAQQRESARLAPPLSVAELDRVRTAVADALTGFLDQQRATLAAMDASLVPVVEEVCAVAEGGKKLRPSFAYWGWRGARGQGPGAGEDEDAVLRAVAALEFVHASALVHDDVMDAAGTRRGRPSTHVGFAGRHADSGFSGDEELFGVGAAILVGDLALVWSDELLRCSGISEAALGRARAVWDTMRTEVTAGQYLDLLRAAGGLPGPDGALTVARYKSAGYTVQRPLQLGVAIAGAGPRVVEACTAIGLPLGEAFQLRDDLLGVFGDPEVTGKSADDDLREGKQTLLVALAAEAADDAGRALLDELLGNPEAGHEEFEALRDLLVGTGARDRVEERIALSTARAREAIAEAPLADDARRALDALAVAATSRTA